MLNLKDPASQSIALTGARGLVGEAYMIRPGLFEVRPELFAEYTQLKAGEETAVTVTLQDLPPNADVKTFVATLQVGEAYETPPSETSSVKIKQGGGPETALSVTMDAATRPRNVSIRLDQGGPFWNFGGSLVNNNYELHDFAQQVNAYLDKVKPDANGIITLKFLVKSDTAGGVNISVKEKKLTRLQTQTWPNELDQTLRVDRNLQLEFGQRHKLPLDALQSAGTLAAIRMDVGGTFGPERMLGTVQPHTGHDFATLSNDYALAQGFVLDRAVKAVGVSGAFIPDRDAELYIELQPDANGAPAADAPLAKSNLTLKASADDAASCVYAEFAAPADLSAGTPYWIVVKGVHGNVRLGVEVDAETYLRDLVVNRSGKLWKPFDRAVAHYVSRVRVVYLPELDNQSAAIRVGVNESLWQSVDPGATPSSVFFAVGGTDASKVQPAVVIIESQARGALTLANVTQEY